MSQGKAIAMVGIDRRAWLAATLLLAACGGESPDFAIRGTGIFVRSEAAFTRQSDFPSRVESTIQAALDYWGGSWGDLEGSTISFEGAPHVRCGDVTSAVGCYDGDIRVSTRDAAFTYYCVEETALVHEVGHAVIGDPDHMDPRWLDFRAVASVLAGRRGYGDRDELPCDIFVSVWRHPPAQHGERTSSPQIPPSG
jgi:hypothetical protein